MITRRINQLLLLIYIYSIKSQLLFSDSSGNRDRSHSHYKRNYFNKNSSKSKSSENSNPSSSSSFSSNLRSYSNSNTNIRTNKSNFKQTRNLLSVTKNINNNNNHNSLSPSKNNKNTNCPKNCLCKSGNYLTIYCKKSNIESFKDSIFRDYILNKDIYGEVNLAILNLPYNNITHVLEGDMVYFEGGEFSRLRVWGVCFFGYMKKMQQKIEFQNFSKNSKILKFQNSKKRASHRQIRDIIK